MDAQRLKDIFPEFSMDLIEEIIACGTHKFIDAGTEIMDIGRPIREVPLLLKGKIKVFRPDELGNELFLYFLYPGDACALSLVCSASTGRSNVRAEAVEECEVMAVPVQYMDEWMRKYRTWYYYVLGTYRGRFEEVLRTVDGIAFHNMDERLVRYLLKNQEAAASDELHITHQDIAYELNSSREVISRLLKKLEQRGIISLGRNSIKILKPLEKLVDF
ncbi:MAG: Crp/Fnr family transcriptional regulator [Flavobacteriales bacterium]|nr:Crp/Fnr family transcriptional regulator [Flavobacteriales bacterium]